MKKIIGLTCLIVLAWCFFSIQQDTNAFEIPENLITALSARSGVRSNLEQRIALTLQNVGKNLILESIRGAKEISIYQKVSPSVVFILTDGGFGSGSLVDNEGHVITNLHVVKNYTNIIVVFKPRDSAELKKELAFTTQVVKIDRIKDLALLKINTPPKNFSFLKLGNSSSIAVGQDAHAIGHPNGEIWTYTKGFISQIRSGYEWVTTDGMVHRANVIQTQTPINPGSSGGPLFNDQGNLIGINSFQRVQAEGLNFAVAVDEIQDFLRRKGGQEGAPSQLGQKPQCDEAYDTTGQGWPNIIGCYLNVRASRPDFWLVYLEPNRPANYMALDSYGKGHIDTIIISKDLQWLRMMYLIDRDCDGIVDLIGLQDKGQDEIGSYRRPAKKLSIVKLAKELDDALKRSKLPYPGLRVCQ